MLLSKHKYCSVHHLIHLFITDIHIVFKTIVIMVFVFYIPNIQVMFTFKSEWVFCPTATNAIYWIAVLKSPTIYCPFIHWRYYIRFLWLCKKILEKILEFFVEKIWKLFWNFFWKNITKNSGKNLGKYSGNHFNLTSLPKISYFIHCFSYFLNPTHYLISIIAFISQRKMT